MGSGQYSYKPCVLYSLPKDIASQAIGEKTIERSLEKVKDFLKSVADVSEVGFYKLVAYIPAKGARNYEVGLQKIARARALFGPGSESPVAYSYPDGSALPQREIEWEFEPVNYAPYLAFIIDQQPIPLFEMPLFQLIGITYFSLTDGLGNKLPNQTNPSSIMVWLGRNSAIDPVIWLPFENLDDKFEAYRKLLSEMFPGKFNERYLRKVKPVKSGTSYQLRKL
ncbi:hypothetical protein ACFQT0_17440 [Hymenobacter humi]|uniref:Uncharacterized protein n=1 Tax=Hymenobacter humi TaxID=1411620 RepID=A0ABW2U653_9BACT